MAAKSKTLKGQEYRKKYPEKYEALKALQRERGRTAREVCLATGCDNKLRTNGVSRTGLCHKHNGREHRLSSRYGIGLEDYANLAAAHGQGCWVCGKLPTKMPLHVEHDHKTQRVRGLACFMCNRGLAQFRDNPARLRAAADYLESEEADRILRKDTNAS